MRPSRFQSAILSCRVERLLLGTSEIDARCRRYAMSKTVMFIPGAWLTPASFDLFRTSYEARGYSCVAPARRLEDRPIEELRRSAHLDLHKLTIGKIVDHLECALARDHEVVVYLQVPE